MLLFAIVLAAAAPRPAATADTPAEIVKFLDRRAGCDHWTGEEPYDAARRREIEAAIADLKCARIERDEAALRKRYAADPALLHLIAEGEGNP
jgi:hypothetical protein